MAEEKTTPAPVASPEAAPAPRIQISSTERIFATIGYVGPLFILPLVTQPKSEYCKFHARQSMGLFALFFAFLIILGIVPLLGSLITFGLFALYVLAMYKAYMGEKWLIPVMGTVAQKIDFDAMLGKATNAVANMNVSKETPAETPVEKK